MELIWPAQEASLIILLRWIEITIVICSKEMYLPGKWALKNFLKHLQMIQKDQKVELNASISFDDFKELLKVTQFYMTWCHTSLEPKLSTFLRKVWQKNFWEDFADTCSMLSMTAPGQEAIADAIESASCSLKESQRHLRHRFSRQYVFNTTKYLLQLPRQFVFWERRENVANFCRNWKFFQPRQSRIWTGVSSGDRLRSR